MISMVCENRLKKFDASADDEQVGDCAGCIDGVDDDEVISCRTRETSRSERTCFGGVG